MGNLKRRKNKIHFLCLFFMLIGVVFISCEEYMAYTKEEAMHKAAKKYGWTWTDLGAGQDTYLINNFCPLDSTTVFYFASWDPREKIPTCTEGAVAYFNCKFASDCGVGVEEQHAHHLSIAVDALGHEYNGVKSSTYGNNGNGDGYWYQKCGYCDVWEKQGAISYNIEYQNTHISAAGTGNSGSMNKSSHLYDKTQNLSKNIFQKTGHKFIGWATSPTGNVVYTDSQSVLNLTVKDGATITLYAVWEPLIVSITYNANGGVIEGTTSESITNTLYQDADVDLSVRGQREGLTFIGWALAPDAPTGLSSFKMPSYNVTLYAIYSLPVSDMKEAVLVIWEKENRNNFKTYPLNLIHIDASGYSYNIANLAASSGLIFSSQEDLDWGIVLYDNAGNSSMLHSNVPIPKRYLQTVTHYVWNIEKQEFVYHSTTSSLAYEGETYTPQYLLESDENYPLGYAPSSIDSPYVVTTDTITSAYYMPIEYKLHFDANGGLCNTEYKTVYNNYYYGELPVAERDGHDFLGWFTDPVDGTQIRNTDMYTIIGDSTVYAHWNIRSHNVVYDFWTNGGENGTVNTNKVDYGMPVDLSVQAVKSGWDFIGWNIYPDATTGLTEYVMQDQDVVLYAIYKKDLTATFIDKTDTDYVTRVIGTTLYGTKEQGSIVVPLQNELSGWNALGWATGTEVDAEVMASSDTTISLAHNITYYGLYNKEITLSYDTNEAAWEIPSITLEGFFNASGQILYPTFDLSTTPSLDNHSFVDWVELNENNEIVTSYQAGTSVTLEKDTLLIARWDKFPEIEAYDRYFTLEDAQNGSITSEKLLEKVIARDKEDGILENGTSVIVKGFDTLDFLSGEEIEVAYQAVDSFGNTVTKTITVHVVDTTVSLSPIIYYTRFISKEFYSDGENLIDVSEGGLENTSIWRSDENYKRVIEHSLFNTKKNEEYKIIDVLGLNEQVKVAGSGEWEHFEETWKFNHEDIEAVKEFINEHGYGNIKEANAVDRFLELFYRCKNK